MFETDTKTPSLANIHLVDAYGFSTEELADFTQRAYMLTPEDRAVHQGNAYISNRENVLKFLEAAKDGKMGFSPPEFWRVAKFKGNVVGFVVAFMRRKTKYQPAHGVIAELGVFPEYRRMGIAQLLITDVFKSFKKHGCHCALVGTPKANTPALNVYTKLGFVPVFENVFLQKIL
jgi:ribosomal protein S18 acetylase RimI-like enzyme